MKLRLAWAAPLVLLGCDASPQEQATAPAAADRVAGTGGSGPEGGQPSKVPAGTLGTRSSLSSETSALTGDVSDFLVSVTDTGTRVALASDTLFAFDKAELAPEAISNLQRVADMVRGAGVGAITVTGHTDAKGDDGYNQTLSLRRAQAVANWLRQQPGLNERAISAVGKGEAAPVAPNTRPDGLDDPEGRGRNRRVEVDIPRA